MLTHTRAAQCVQLCFSYPSSSRINKTHQWASWGILEPIQHNHCSHHHPHILFLIKFAVVRPPSQSVHFGDALTGPGYAAEPEPKEIAFRLFLLSLPFGCVSLSRCPTNRNNQSPVIHTHTNTNINIAITKKSCFFSSPVRWLPIGRPSHSHSRSQRALRALIPSVVPAVLLR